MPASVGITLVAIMVAAALCAVLTGEWRWLLLTAGIAVVLRKV